MQCYVHSEAAAVGACTSCGRAVCRECATEVQGKLICRNCLAVGRLTTSGRDPNTAFIIELVGGIFGLLGIGYLYAGRTNDGIMRLVLWIVYNAIAWIVISLLFTIIVGFVCLPFQLAIGIGVPIWSANTLKKELLQRPSV